MGRKVSGLYAITPETTDTEWLMRRTHEALRGGVKLVQYRNKSGDPDKHREQLAELVPLCRRWGAPVIVNDSVALAREFSADGVHLGRDDSRVAAARAELGPDILIGVSCYDELQRARDAVSAGADYVAFGSFYPSATKPGAARAKPDLLRAARKEISAPIVAIGGIDALNAAELIAAGADAIAVVTALFAAQDVELASRTLASLFNADSGLQA